MKVDKLELLNDTLFYALGYGKLNLIKHLINKTVNSEYAPINFQRAIIGYNFVNKYNKERLKDYFQYTSYFANIERETKNSYINEKSKEIFFNSDLLLKLIYTKDIDPLNLYKKIISEEQIVKDIATIVRNNDDNITDNNQQLIEGLKWFFLESMETDFSKNKTIILGASRNRDLEIYLEKIKLHEKMDNEFPLKNTANKKHKI